MLARAGDMFGAAEPRRKLPFPPRSGGERVRPSHRWASEVMAMKSSFCQFIPVELGAVICPSGESRFYGRLELPPQDGERLASFLPSVVFAAGALLGAAVAFHYAEAGDEDDDQDDLREESLQAER